MNSKKIDFDNVEWEKSTKGIEQKQFLNGNQRIRLVRFYDNFIEKDWCIKGHIGYVVNGEMAVDFNGDLVHYKKGSGIWIESGEESKHKVQIAKGKFVELILFEEV